MSRYPQTETSFVSINETEEDYISERQEWFVRQIDRQVKERRTRALRANFNKKVIELQPHILENPHFATLENFSLHSEKVINALDLGLNVCIIFQGEQGFEKVVETALQAIQLYLNKPGNNQITSESTIQLSSLKIINEIAYDNLTDSVLEQAPMSIYCSGVSYLRALLLPHNLKEDTMVHSINIESFFQDLSSKICLVRLPYAPLSVGRVSICSKFMIEGTVEQLKVFKNVLEARADQSSEWIPYRESTLTTYLQDHLSGNSRLIFVSELSSSSIFEKARSIKQCIKHNQASNLKKLKQEIKTLESQLFTLESKCEYSSGSKDIFLVQSHLLQQINRLKSHIIIKVFKQEKQSQAETRGILTEAEINKTQLTAVKRKSHTHTQPLPSLQSDCINQYRFSMVSQNLRFESQIRHPSIDDPSPLSNQDNSSSVQEITIFNPYLESPFKSVVDREIEIVPAFEQGRVSLLSPNLIRLNSLCSISSVKQVDPSSYKDDLVEQFSDIMIKLKSSSAIKKQKTLANVPSNSTLDLMDKLSLAFATPFEREEVLLDGDIMSELNRMSLPADLLRTRKLSDIKYFNECGDNLLFNDDLIQDFEKQFDKLPVFLTKRESKKIKFENNEADNQCNGCESVRKQMVGQIIQVEDLQRRLKECEMQNNSLRQDKTELVEYVGFLEERLQKEQEINKQYDGCPRKRQLSLIFEEDNESGNSD